MSTLETASRSCGGAERRLGEDRHVIQARRGEARKMHVHTTAENAQVAPAGPQRGGDLGAAVQDEVHRPARKLR